MVLFQNVEIEKTTFVFKIQNKTVNITQGKWIQN